MFGKPDVAQVTGRLEVALPVRRLTPRQASELARIGVETRHT